MILTRLLTRSRVVRTAFASKRGFKQTIDEPVDEQFHFVPMGKSDISLQSRVSFISRDMSTDKRICIQTVSSNGFRLSDAQFMFGPIAVFPKTVLSWRVPTSEDITAESLELFFSLQPRLDILIIGAGNRENVDKVRARIAPVLKEHKVAHEIWDTESAVSTFNFLNNEGRFVAAALMPPEHLSISEYQHGKALRMVQDPWELTESPMFLGLHYTHDNVEDVVNNTFLHFSAEERKAILERVRQIRAKNVEKKIKYLEAIQEKNVSDERLDDVKKTRRLWKEELKRLEQIKQEKEEMLEKK